MTFFHHFKNSIFQLKRHILTLSIFVFSLSCSDKQPEGVLSRKDMINVLVRIHLAEAKANNSYLTNDTLKIFYQSLEDSIFKKYNTSKAGFEKSYQYYLQKPKEMDKMYAEVVDSLSLREAIKNINY